MKHPASKTIGYQLTHVARLHRARTARALSGLGLFPGQEQVLEALVGRDGMTMSELAEILRVRPPTASKTIGRLSALGLIDRKSNADDGRVVHVALTEAGRAKAQAIDAVALDIEHEAVSFLDPKDRKRLRKLLKRLAKGLKGAAAAEDEEDDDAAEDVDADEA